MKVFADLEVSPISEGSFEYLAQKIEDILPAGWQRNIEREKEVSGLGSRESRCYAYTSTGGGRRFPGANVWFTRTDDHAYVSNIVPSQRGSLTYDQYNGILRCFFDEIVRPAASALGLEAKMTKIDVELDDIVSPGTAECLRGFSNLANKSTGSAHPLDRKRWYAFLVSYYRNKDDIPTDLLGQWLTDQGWDDDETQNLVTDFEQGIGLLKYYVEQGR